MAAEFVVQARSQSRPPLALLGLLSDDNPNHGATTPETLDCPPWKAREPNSKYLHLSSIDDSSVTTAHSVNLRRRHTDSEVLGWSTRQSTFAPLRTKQFSSSSSCCAEEVEEEEPYDPSLLQGKFHLPSAFQSLLQSRRTVSRFTPLTAPSPIYEEHEYWSAALERAVLCGYQAPNHKRTEPFTFKRLISPSTKTDRLAEIAYRVALRKATQDDSLTNEQLALKREKAQRKKEKWSNIPAFLIATVEEETPLENDLEMLNEYDELPYMPPQTERELENYASSCAAVQNVLLSLHAESIATKWATGPVIKTPAFRELIQARENDRIVALIMVGKAGGPVPKSPRRLRRPLRSGSTNDILIDL